MRYFLLPLCCFFGLSVNAQQADPAIASAAEGIENRVIEWR